MDGGPNLETYPAFDKHGCGALCGRLRGSVCRAARPQLKSVWHLVPGYHELHQQHSRPDDREEAPKQQARIGSGFSVPELTNNLELLVDLTERRIVHNDRETRHEEDRSVNLRHEVERLDDLVAQEREQEQRLQKVADIVKG